MTHGSRFLTKTRAIDRGALGFWECHCGKRYATREGLRRHLRRHGLHDHGPQVRPESTK